jgi:hypothetical protein
LEGDDDNDSLSRKREKEKNGSNSFPDAYSGLTGKTGKVGGDTKGEKAEGRVPWCDE